MSFNFFFEVGITTDGFEMTRQGVPDLDCSVLEGSATILPTKLRDNKIEVAIPGIIPVSFGYFNKIVTHIVW